MTQKSTPRADDLLPFIPAMRRLARILTNSPEQAEDLAQEALLQVWARLKSGHEIQNLRAYLMTTIRNASRRGTAHNVALSEDNTPSCAPVIWQRMACADVMTALARLPKEQRELLRPLAVAGISYRELARTKSLPIGTVMSRINRARHRLRQDMNLPESFAVEYLLKAPT